MQSYIRSRKLAKSVEQLLLTKKRILEIALECGYEHEQTFIRAFKREFGLTPGEYRHSKRYIQVTPPLQLFPDNNVNGSLLYGPDMVMIPSFHLIGQLHRIEIEESLSKAPEVAKQFWWKERHAVLNPIEPNIYYGLTRSIDPSLSWTYYLPSVRVNDLRDVPDGFKGDTIPASMYVGFRYIGNHHYEEIDGLRAVALYRAIDRFAREHCGKYELLDHEIFFEKINTEAYDGQFCEMEWFAPIKLKHI